jgi:hypothetical protein
LSGVATFGGGSIEVQMLGPDGSTYLSMPTQIKLTANRTIGGYFPFGTYRLLITTATGVYAEIASVPLS